MAYLKTYLIVFKSNMNTIMFINIQYAVYVFEVIQKWNKNWLSQYFLLLA